MKKFLLTILLTVLMIQSASAIIVDRNGFYVDGTGQIPEYARIAPPNENKVPPVPHPTQTVVPFDRYTDINIRGLRRAPYMEQYVPNYNVHYSNRRAEPYTKQEYIDVWCTGEKNVNKVDCSTDEYSIYFFPVRNWAWGVTSSVWRARKTHKRCAIFFWVDDLGLDAKYMYDAKKWAELYNTTIHFGTIDAYIPQSWVY